MRASKMKISKQVPVIEEFKVEGLQGFPDRAIRFTNNQLILVGENGAGKTTLSRMLAYLLTRQWGLLSNYDFKKVQLTYSLRGKKQTAAFDKKTWEASRAYDDFKSLFLLDGDVTSTARYSAAYRHRGDIESYDYKYLLNRLSSEMHYRDYSEKDSKFLVEFKKLNEQMEEAFSQHVLYLPTYRRIEEEWESFFNESRGDALRERRLRESYLSRQFEIISFGMKDVEKLIGAKTAELREYSRREQNALSIKYLKKLIKREYQQIDYSQFNGFDVDTVISILNRVNEDILTGEEKIELANAVLRAISSENPSALTDSDKMLCHYFLLLREFDISLKEKEKCFSEFIATCNSYLKDKAFEYNPIDYSCSIVRSKNNSNGKLRIECADGEKATVALKNLSSGEKQIVGLFSKLYLDNTHGLFVFIDEPELSLSIDWQRRLLPDVIASDNCKGLFAVTHSPFIFDNDLVGIVHGVNEF